ncbi:MAG: tetratricopeptide repeat protein [Chloroflexi bacterium]|nr:tetratricopeptide repeat protein [Chloroflexota bacterium]
MRDLDETQPSRSYYLQDHSGGLQGPPRLLMCGVILFTLLIVVGAAGAIVAFREVLQPAQQQRVIDQLPFMRMFKEPTPVGGLFPTLASRAGESDALALLDMPLEFASPTAPASAASATPAAVLLETVVLSTATQAPTRTAAATAASNVAEIATASPSPDPPTATRPNAINIAPVNLSGGELPSSARIYGILHQQQTWNNCGPATITMAMSYYGWQQDQAAAGSALKPNREDKNVSPQEMADYVEEASNLKAIVRMGGTLDLLKHLVANEFPVVIETGAMFEAYDWIGHYRALVAYDDVYQRFYFFDSFLGVGEGAQGVAISYDEVDRDWGAFNRTFIVVYEPQREGLLRSLMDSHWDPVDAAQLAFDVAQAEARLDPSDAFAWFNMGTSLVALGRYQEAAAAFDQSRRLGPPWRMMWYQFGAFEAYYQLGRYDDVLSLVKVNLNNAEEIEETHYWQGLVLQAQGKPEQAASSFRRALAYNPNYDEARAALASLG